MTEEQQPHTQLTTAINTDSAVIVGDPARVDKAAKLLDDVQKWAFNREYKSVIGTYKGKRILIMSTGVELHQLASGLKNLIMLMSKRSFGLVQLVQCKVELASVN